MKIITNELVQKFKQYLTDEEKAIATTEKYIHDVKCFMVWICGEEVTKAKVVKYKQKLIEKLAPSSVNSALASINSFFIFSGWYECRVKTIKIQQKVFLSENKELTREEYMRLLDVSKQKKNKRLYYLLQTICATGIRVSELKYITVDAVRNGQAVINCKGKMRMIILTRNLCRALKDYIKRNKIKSGSVFVTKTGKPLDRSNIWSDMKKLCESANVDKAKVFPHNLRHLFARTYYSVQKDIVRLADVLGHSSVNTTRIYTMETGEIHRVCLEKLRLLKC